MEDKVYVIIHSLKSKMPRRLILITGVSLGRPIDPKWAGPGEGMIVVKNPSDTTDMFGMARMIAAHHKIPVEQVRMPRCAFVDRETSKVLGFIAADEDLDEHHQGHRLANCEHHVGHGWLHDLAEGKFKKRLLTFDSQGVALRERWVEHDVKPTGVGGSHSEVEDHTDTRVGDVREDRKMVRHPTTGVRTL